MEIVQYRIITDEPKVSRDYGWTKNHHRVEFFWAGKWRTAGFFTRKQREGANHLHAITKKIHTNSRYKGPIEFHEQ